MNFIIILQDKLYIKHCSLTRFHSLFLSADDLVYIGVLGVHNPGCTYYTCVLAYGEASTLHVITTRIQAHAYQAIIAGIFVQYKFSYNSYVSYVYKN